MRLRAKAAPFRWDSQYDNYGSDCSEFRRQIFRKVGQSETQIFEFSVKSRAQQLSPAKA